jgi:hypothetical protein
MKMELFPAIVIVIIVIIIIIIIVIIIIVTINRKGETTNGVKCTNQNDCPLGHVCVQDNINDINICKSGIGTVCNSDSDCIHELVCSTMKICSSKEIAKNIEDITGGSKIQRICYGCNKVGSKIRCECELCSHLVVGEDFAPFVKNNGIDHNLSLNRSFFNRSKIKNDIEIKDPNQDTVTSVSQSLPIENSTNVQQNINLTDRVLSYLPNTRPSNDTFAGGPRRNPTLRPIIHRGYLDITPLTDIEFVPNSDVMVKNQNNVTILKETTVLTEYGQRLRKNNTDTSTDNEINSGGNFIDGPFDVRSPITTQDYLSIDVNNSRDNDTVEIIECIDSDDVTGVHTHTIVDACSYSNATVYLLQDGDIICEIDSDIKTEIEQRPRIFHKSETKNRYRSSNNIHLVRITTFDGYLYGLGFDKKLYTLPGNFFLTAHWIWKLVPWAPLNITHISSTYDVSYLWIQTFSDGYMYNASGQLLHKMPYKDLKRMYGRTMNHYIDINPMKYNVTVYPENVVLDDIYDAVLSYYDEVIVIHPSERNKYRGITIVNWRPYYILA